MKNRHFPFISPHICIISFLFHFYYFIHVNLIFIYDFVNFPLWRKCSAREKNTWQYSYAVMHIYTTPLTLCVFECVYEQLEYHKLNKYYKNVSFQLDTLTPFSPICQATHNVRWILNVRSMCAQCAFVRRMQVINTLKSFRCFLSFLPNTHNTTEHVNYVNVPICNYVYVLKQFIYIIIPLCVNQTTCLFSF